VDGPRRCFASVAKCCRSGLRRACAYADGADGLALSLMGLGLVLVAIGWLYRRILFRRQAAPPSDGAVLRTNLDVD
jgi:hypothetical protein